MWDATSNNAHAIRVQGGKDVAPSSTRSQACNRLVGTDSDLVQSLQVDKNTLRVDAGPARIRGMAAATEGEFRLEELNNLQRLGYILWRSWEYRARWRKPACFRP